MKFKDNIELVKAIFIDTITNKEYELFERIQGDGKASRCLFACPIIINNYEIIIRLDFEDNTLLNDPILDIDILNRNEEGKVIQQIKDSKWHHTSKDNETSLYSCIINEKNKGINLEFNLIFKSTKATKINSDSYIIQKGEKENSKFTI